MRKEIQFTKKEIKLQFFLILIALMSFIVIGLGVYFQEHNMDNDHILVPTLVGLYVAFFGIYAYNGLTDANLIKKWTPFYIYNITLWLMTKIMSDGQKAEKITTKIITIIAISVNVLLLILLLTSFKN